MAKKNKVFDPKGQKETIDSLNRLFSKILRDGARFLFGGAVRCELEEFLKQYEGRRLIKSLNTRFAYISSTFLYNSPS